MACKFKYGESRTEIEKNVEALEISIPDILHLHVNSPILFLKIVPTLLQKTLFEIKKNSGMLRIIFSLSRGEVASRAQVLEK